VPRGAEALLATYRDAVEIVQGPTIMTKVPESIKHLKADVLTLDGKVV